MKEDIIKVLNEHLSVEKIDIEDESDKHAHHPEALKSGGSHFSILIVSDDFKSKSLVERHRMIYQILKKEMRDSIHALAIKALTAEEFAQNQ